MHIDLMEAIENGNSRDIDTQSFIFANYIFINKDLIDMIME